MGIFDFFKRFFSGNDQNELITSQPSEDPQQMEIIVTQEDMMLFTMLPFDFDSEIKYASGTFTPWYMDLSQMNQLATEDQIEIINDYLKQAPMFCNSLPEGLEIPINEIIYSSKDYGYTRLFCTPCTKTGKRSKYPVELFVTTDQHNKIKNVSANIYYLIDGKIGKARVVFWDNHICYIFTLKMVGSTLAITEIKSNRNLPDGMPAEVIYKLNI